MPFGFGILSIIRKTITINISSVNKSVVDFSGGSSVIITGSGFTGAASVKFASTDAASFIINSDTQITAITPALTASSTPVGVSVNSVTLPNAIEFFAPTNIASCFMWMRADLGYTAADTNTWIDQVHGKVFDTNNGYFVGAGTYPALTTGLNGKAALSFTGNKSIGNATALNTNGVQEFFVGKSDSAGLSNSFRDYSGASGGSDPFWTLSGDIYDSWNIENRGNSSGTNHDAALVAGFVAETQLTGSPLAQVLYLNGTQIINYNNSGSGITLATDGTPTYGRSRSGVATAGYIQEDIVFSSILSGGEHTRVAAYLLDRYGVIA